VAVAVEEEAAEPEAEAAVTTGAVAVAVAVEEEAAEPEAEAAVTTGAVAVAVAVEEEAAEPEAEAAVKSKGNVLQLITSWNSLLADEPDPCATLDSSLATGLLLLTAENAAHDCQLLTL
jgi:hypothetical protein